MALSASDQALYARVLHFVRSETRTGKQLQETTDLAKDLGVDGDDAVEFMLEFQREFSVDMTNFQFDRYFGGEGFSLIPFVISLLKMRNRRFPLTVAHLFNAANHRCWPAESTVG